MCQVRGCILWRTRFTWPPEGGGLIEPGCTEKAEPKRDLSAEDLFSVMEGHIDYDAINIQMQKEFKIEVYYFMSVYHYNYLHQGRYVPICV